MGVCVKLTWVGPAFNHPGPTCHCTKIRHSQELLLEYKQSPHINANHPQAAPIFTAAEAKEELQHHEKRCEMIHFN